MTTSRLSAGAALLATSIAAHAQAPGVPIETNNPRTGNADVLARAGKLREAGKLLPIDRVKEQEKAPVGGAVALAKTSRDALPGREVAKRAREAYLQIGWYYLCPRCDHWHLNLAGAYAIAKDTIVTCHHCIDPKIEMREGYFIAVDHTGEVVPVTAVVARSQSMDAAILRVEGGNFTPLPLSDQVAPGDAAYCFSDPLGQEGYFSAGIVNRFFWKFGKRGEPGSLDEVKSLRVNVSTDWAPGSSGAAVLDNAGNAIGHVSTISPLSEAGRGGPPAAKSQKDGKAEQPQPQNDRFKGATLITLHDAVPARGILALVNAAAKSPPKAEPAPTASFAEFKARLERRIEDEKWSDARKDLETITPRVPAEDLEWFAFAQSQIAIGAKDATLANELSRKLAADPKVSWEVANDVAWALIVADGMTGLDLPAIEGLARRGVEVAPGDAKAPVLDTLARIVFRQGRTDEAIKLQEQAMEVATDESTKERVTATLRAYQEGKLPPAE